MRNPRWNPATRHRILGETSSSSNLDPRNREAMPRTAHDRLPGETLPHPSRVVPTGRYAVTGLRPAACPPHDWPPIPPFKNEVPCRRCGDRAILRKLT